jgi:hypothetical protein
MRCTVIFEERVATFFEEIEFFDRVATRDGKADSYDHFP